MATDWTGYGVNRYGTPISIHRCAWCGHEFTVCPAKPEGFDYRGCQSPDCASYDIGRDIDRIWDDLVSLGAIAAEPIVPPAEGGGR